MSKVERNSVNASRRRKGNIPTRSVLPFRELSAFVSDNYCLLGARTNDVIDVVFAIFDRDELSLQRSLLAIGHLQQDVELAGSKTLASLSCRRSGFHPI